MDLLLQTLGVLGLTVALAGVATVARRPRIHLRGALVPACLLVGAVAFLARGPSDVRTVVTGANNTYRSWATVPTSQAYAIIAGQYGIPAAFIEWFRGQMRPGETYYWALGPPPRKDPNAWLYQYHNHWITYEMLPYVAVETPRKADVVMLYNMTERRWRRTHPGRISIRMFDAKHGIGRWQR